MFLYIQQCEIVRLDVLDVYPIPGNYATRDRSGVCTTRSPAYNVASHCVTDAFEMASLIRIIGSSSSEALPSSRPWSRGRGGQASVSRGPAVAGRQGTLGDSGHVTRPLAAAAAWTRTRALVARRGPAVTAPCLPCRGAHRHCSTESAARRGATAHTQAGTNACATRIVGRCLANATAAPFRLQQRGGGRVRGAGWDKDGRASPLGLGYGPGPLVLGPGLR